MKNFFALLALLLIPVQVCVLAGCNNSEVSADGTYYLKSLFSVESRSITVEKDNPNAYRYFDGQYIDFSDHYIEIKDGKMTVYGSIDYILTNIYEPEDGVLSDIYFQSGDGVKTYNFELVKERSTLYRIQSDGEYINYSFQPQSDNSPTTISYSEGTSGKSGYCFYTYEKV